MPVESFSLELIPHHSLVNDEYRQFFWKMFILRNRNKFVDKLKGGIHYLCETTSNW